MKILVTNKFHDTEAEFTVKDKYRDSSGTLDTLALMDYEVCHNGSDKAYCVRKLRQIKNDLCGSKDCQCTLKCEDV